MELKQIYYLSHILMNLIFIIKKVINLFNVINIKFKAKTFFLIIIFKIIIYILVLDIRKLKE